MKYNITVNGKFFETDSLKVYNDLSESKTILEWMIDEGCDYKLAAIEFDFREKTLRLKLARAGHKAVVDWAKRRNAVVRACKEHVETGSISKTCAELGLDEQKMKYRMQNSGYSFQTRQYTLHRPDAKTLKTKTNVQCIADIYEKILYNKILSYQADFQMFQAYHLIG